MERTNRNELGNDRNVGELLDGREKGAHEVRTLADLELMLVGGGDEIPDWGG